VNALVAMMLTGILLLTGCGSPPAEPPGVEVSGGIVLEHSAEQIRIRAVSPEVAIHLTGKLQWKQQGVAAIGECACGPGDCRMDISVL
jgi:hypothetical protein